MRDQIYHMTVSTGASIVRGLEQMLGRSSLVGNPAFFRHEAFPWTTRIDASWKTMRAELDRVLERRGDLPNFQDMSKDQRHLCERRCLEDVLLLRLRLQMRGELSSLPRDDACCSSRFPGMKTAFFSILAPGKHIPAHRGPFKGVIRYHLGLMVPEPRERCRIRRGSRVRALGRGPGSDLRRYLRARGVERHGWRPVVLFLDFVRPLKQPARALNAAVLNLIRWSPFVQDGVQNYKQWEAKFDQPTARRDDAA